MELQNIFIATNGIGTDFMQRDILPENDEYRIKGEALRQAHAH